MINLKSFDNIVFDFDGTIADTLQIHENAFSECLKDFNLNYKYADYLGQTTAFTISQIFKKNKIVISEIELSQLVLSKRTLANALIKNNSKFIEGADVFINYLFDQKKAMYIASSGSKMNVEEGIKALEIEYFFQGIVTAEDVSRSKPDPEIYNKVIEKYGLVKEKSIVLEDAVLGIRSALDARLPVICINPQIDICQFDDDRVQSFTYTNLMDFINI